LRRRRSGVLDSEHLLVFSRQPDQGAALEPYGIGAVRCVALSQHGPASWERVRVGSWSFSGTGRARTACGRDGDVLYVLCVGKAEAAGLLTGAVAVIDTAPSVSEAERKGEAHGGSGSGSCAPSHGGGVPGDYGKAQKGTIQYR
jgi:hypothetical protein